MINQIHIFESKTLIYLYHSFGLHSTFTIIPESDVLVILCQGGAGELWWIFGYVAWITGVNKSLVLQASTCHLYRRRIEGGWFNTGVSQKPHENLVLSHPPWSRNSRSIQLNTNMLGISTTMGNMWSAKSIGTQSLLHVDQNHMSHGKIHTRQHL